MLSVYLAALLVLVRLAITVSFDGVEFNPEKMQFPQAASFMPPFFAQWADNI